MGVEHVIVSAGARCAPLVAVVANKSIFRVQTYLDERSAAFSALGVGKATHRPAVLICTSGTAGANYYPAVIEARMTGTPMIVITADRPPSVRGKGAPQTIDQVDLFGRFALSSRDLPLAQENVVDEWTKEASRAFATSIGRPTGPVHINTPFGEPLLPEPNEIPVMLGISHGERRQPIAPVSWPNIGKQMWVDIKSVVRQAQRPLIVCGPQNTADDLAYPVHRLAKEWDAPVLADIASGVRLVNGNAADTTIISHYDLILRERSIRDALCPDAVLRFGGLPTSKTLNQWLSGLDCPKAAIDDNEIIADPDDCFPIKCQSDLSSCVNDLIVPERDHALSVHDYARKWAAADHHVREFLTNRLAQVKRSNNNVFEGDIVRAVFETAPDGMIFLLSNGLPIRLADMYVSARDKTMRILCNRGVNGIDGVTSTAVGIARATGEPTTLIIGDIAFWHDANGLSGLTDEPLTIVLINNNGGGIFSFVPMAAHTDFFDPLIAMPHNRNFSGIAEWYGIRYRQSKNSSEFESAYQKAIEQRGPAIIEVATDRSVTRSEFSSVVDDVRRQLVETQPSPR